MPYAPPDTTVKPASAISAPRSVATVVPYGVAVRDPTIATDRSASCPRWPGPRSQSPNGTPPRRCTSSQYRRSPSRSGHSASPGTTNRARLRAARASTRSRSSCAARSASPSPNRPSDTCCHAAAAPEMAVTSATAGSPPSITQLRARRVARSAGAAAPLSAPHRPSDDDPQRDRGLRCSALSRHLPNRRSRTELVTLPHGQRDTDLVDARPVLAGEVCDGPADPPRLVDPAWRQQPTLGRPVQQMQTVRLRQVVTEIRPGDLAVGGQPVSANRLSCRSLACPTRAATTALGSPWASAAFSYAFSGGGSAGDVDPVPDRRRQLRPCSGGPTSAGRCTPLPAVAALPQGQGFAASTSWNRAG